MKITDATLDALLQRKAAGSVAPGTPKPEAFAAAFQNALRQRRRRALLRPLTAAAALFLLSIGLFVGTRSAPPRVPAQVRTEFAKLTFAQNFLGPEVGVVFLNDELATGERLLAGVPPRNRIALELVDRRTGFRTALAFAGADGDTIVLDTPQLSGEILLLPDDAGNLVVDLELQNQTTGQELRDVLVFDREHFRNGRMYQRIFS